MHITLNIAEEALLAAHAKARRERICLGDAISKLVCTGATVVCVRPADYQQGVLRGRFALLPARDEVMTAQRVRDLM